LIIDSKTYQLSGIPNETNQEDEINYSRFVPRPLRPEVLLDAICRVTGVAEDFRVHEYARGGKPPVGTRSVNLLDPFLYPSRFLEVYGRHSRETLEEGPAQPNLAQALHQWAGSTYTSKISKEGGRVDGLLKSGASNQQVLEQVYLAAFSRFPTADERRDLEKMILRRSPRRKAIEALVWAVISSREFASNH
jgi:hypothetical protein